MRSTAPRSGHSPRPDIWARQMSKSKTIISLALAFMTHSSMTNCWVLILQLRFSSIFNRGKQSNLSLCVPYITYLTVVYKNTEEQYDTTGMIKKESCVVNCTRHVYTSLQKLVVEIQYDGGYSVYPFNEQGFLPCKNKFQTLTVLDLFCIVRYTTFFVLIKMTRSRGCNIHWSEYPRYTVHPR